VAREVRPTARGTRTLGAGLTLAVTAFLFSYGGYLLDGQLGTRPLFLILGVLLGAVGGFIHLLRVVAPEMLPFGKEPKRDRRPGDDQHDSPDDMER
jgi:F0F1-type ATP synthase assembly protein I